MKKEAGVRWKAFLLAQGCEPSTVNGKLTALDRFLCFLGQADCKVKHLKIQRRLFREAGRELTRREYDQLLAAARSTGRERLALLMESICSTGIRVSEVRYLTVDAARCGKVEVALKGKIRAILLPGKLCRKLLKYARKNKIASGEIFLTRSGTSLSRKQIWRDERAVPAGGSGTYQGIPSQPAASVRPDVLPGMPGCGKAGRCAGPFFHRDHSHLSSFHGSGARQSAGATASHIIRRQN